MKGVKAEQNAMHATSLRCVAPLALAVLHVALRWPNVAQAQETADVLQCDVPALSVITIIFPPLLPA